MMQILEVTAVSGKSRERENRAVNWTTCCWCSNWVVLVRHCRWRP